MASAIAGCAGNWAGGVRSAGVLDSTAADVDHVVGTNLRGLFCACARGVGAMRSGGGVPAVEDPDQGGVPRTGLDADADRPPLGDHLQASLLLIDGAVFEVTVDDSVDLNEWTFQGNLNKIDMMSHQVSIGLDLANQPAILNPEPEG